MFEERRIDGVLVAGVTALCGGFAVVHPAPTLLAMSGAVWLLRRRLSWWVIAVAGLLWAVSGVRAFSAMQEAQRAHATALTVLSPPQRCEVLVEITRSPVVLTPVGGVVRAGRARVDGIVREGVCSEDSVPLPAALAVRLYGVPEDVGRGTRLRAMVDLGVARRFDNPGSRHPAVSETLRGYVVSGTLLDHEVAREGAGLRAAIDRARAHVRERIEETFAPAVIPHARALVLGEYDLTPGERHAFAASGLAHLLAVSGTHLVLAVLAFGRVLRLLLVRAEWLACRIDVGRVSALTCIAASWLYADFAGGGGSANRAAAMLSVALAARVLGRRPSGIRALGWSVLSAALWHPFAGHDLSFGLSVSATAGIMAWGGIGLSDVTAAWHRWMRVAAQATAAAHVACLPLLLTISSEVPLLAVAANVLAAPVGEIAALPLCLAHSVLWWTGALEQGAAILGSGSLSVVRAIAHAAANGGFVLHVPPPTPWQQAVLAVGVLAVWCAPRRRTRRVLGGLAMLVALELVAVRDGNPEGVLRVTALDVGQGDAILVDLPDGRGMLVDGGGLVGSPIDTGERIVLEVLRHRRRAHLDVVVLSHPHPDHYGGLLRVLEQVPVRELWVSGLSVATRPDGELSRAIRAAAERGTKVRDARELCGATQVFGRAQIDVLGPCPTYDTAVGANDNSVVLRIALGERAALLTGDAEAHQEEQLRLAQDVALDADLLKVGHHGSRTSTSAAWLAAVSPSVAMISCGVRNRFGHPHAVTLDTLAGVAVLRTDRGGAAVWETDGVQHEWRRHRDPWHP